MTRVRRAWCALIVLATTVTVPRLEAQRASPDPAGRVARAVRAETLWSALRFLADDLLEGRGTGARGGELAANYLAAQFRWLGLEPAGDSGTFFHRVPIVTLDPAPTLTIGERTLRYRDEFVAWSERAEEQVRAEGELVFAGFGISAPEWGWDDFRNVDVRGKVLLVLVNDPGLRDASIFRGSILTYYGRWTYKLEEAARRGAAGVLLVHNDTMATYGWNTVRNSWTGDQVRLLAPSTSLVFAGWLPQQVVAGVLAAGGHDFDALLRSAARRDFTPVATGLTVRAAVRSALRRTATVNVVARLRGADQRLGEEAIVIGAHYDHLGIGESVDGDSIMNGAVDNASGVATMLAIAEAFVTTGVRPRRSLLFVAFGAEESGLLGSQAFAARPPVPPAALAAMLNLDGTNLYGPTRDVAALGVDQSALGRLFERAARAEGLRVSTDSSALRRGLFFRSDHFPLARAGVPALSWETGQDFVGRPPGWYAGIEEEYVRRRYHQPDDEILPWYVPDGALQQARVLVRVALAAGNADAQPTWLPTSEFRAAGEARRVRP
jgi:Zn-dependent M28 family amino/carboxypeptidase